MVVEVVEYSSLLVISFTSSIRARSHTGVMDYDEACFHNFPKAVGV